MPTSLEFVAGCLKIVGVIQYLNLLSHPGIISVTSFINLYSPRIVVVCKKTGTSSLAHRLDFCSCSRPAEHMVVLPVLSSAAVAAQSVPSSL